MSYTLVLAEKPSAARNFAKALGGNTGTYSGVNYRISSLVGRTMTISKDFRNQVSDDLVDKYQSWNLEYLPWDATQIAFTRIPNPKTRDILKKLKFDLEGASEVCIATDVDPSGQGELLAWEALSYLGWQGKTSRMYHSDEEIKSVQKAFNERKILTSMDQDGDCVRAWVRDRWDWLSMQWTRVATKIAQEAGCSDMLLREGRLKSVIVSLVAEQQTVYLSYQKVPYFEVRFKSDTGVVFAQEPEIAIRVSNKAELDTVEPSVTTIVCDKVTIKHQAPPKLPDLTDLAAKLAPKGITPQTVLNTYQTMYEDQVVSYPRTEDKFVSPEQFTEMLELTNRIAKVVEVDPSLLTHINPRTSHVKSGGAHGANRPGTNVPKSLNDLDKYGKGAREIYLELALSWLATLCEDREYEHYEGHLQEHPTFKGSCDITTKPGWRVLLDDDDSDPDVVNREVESPGLGDTAEEFVYEGKNKRPQRPTVKWLKTKLEQYDVGTAATRTSTIAEVSNGKDAQLLEKKGVLSLTRTGEVSAALIEGCLISDPSVTEQLHNDMNRCGHFEIEDFEILNNVASMVLQDMQTMKNNVSKIQTASWQKQQSNKSGMLICPVCKQPLKANKAGTVYFCTSRKVEKQDDQYVEIDPGCGFKLGTSIYGQKKLSEKQVIDLLSGKSVHVKGLKSKAGKTYGVVVTLDKEASWGTHIDFDNKKN